MILRFNFASIIQLIKTFDTEQKCIDYLESLRWNGNIVSPYDATSKVYKLKNNLYKCKNSKKCFNVKTGTLLESSNMKLKDWFFGDLSYNFAQKSIFSCQLARDLNTTQGTAWFMLQRIRNCFNIFESEQFAGEVEIDETFIGGKNKFKTGR